MKPDKLDDFLNWEDRVDPRPINSVVTRDNDRDRTAIGAFFTGLIALAAAALPFYGIYVYHGWNIGLFIALAFGMLYYLIFAYFIDFDPDLDNIGFGGFIDNPFRRTDDINSFQMWASIFLTPGRLIAIGLVDFIGVFTGRWRKTKESAN